MRAPPTEARGSATVAVTAVTVAVALVGIAAIAVAAIADTAARAQGGADLAALAAAREARSSVAMGLPATEPACDVAYAVAVRNNVTLLTCSVDSRGHTTVTVSARGLGVGDQSLASVAVARAGPVTPGA